MTARYTLDSSIRFHLIRAGRMFRIVDVNTGRIVEDALYDAAAARTALAWWRANAATLNALHVACEPQRAAR